MCFSAAASFAASAGLAGPGYFCITRTRARGMLAFASTPILFGFQQFTEGFLWLSLKNPDFSSWYKPALYGYSFISQAFWPIWAPLTLWLMETDKRRKKVLNYFLILGAVASLYMLYCLLNYPLSAVAENGHIRYIREFPFLDATKPVLFVMMAVTPFLSTLRYTKWFAWTLMGALILTYFFYTKYLISVWCFFAAILSLLIIPVVLFNPAPVRKLSMG